MAEEAKILVVDDEPHIRRILQFLLEQEGFEVILAEDGQAALETLKSQQPDLILLDVMMPRMDGFTVLKHLRSDPDTATVPVIMLTAKGEASEKVRGLRDGANDYLTKPFNHEELLLRMQNMLAANRAQRDANPLTGLPGNRAIDRECRRRLDSGAPFGFLYVDIDHFKGFNDYYGYSRGDEAITMLARILRRVWHEGGSAGDFIGHVGGDDFVVISAAADPAALARRACEQFDREMRDLHDPEDLERGYFEVKSRSGELERVDLITLTIALVDQVQERFRHPMELIDVVAELKRYGKTLAGSVVVEERRQPGTGDGPETDAQTPTVARQG